MIENNDNYIVECVTVLKGTSHAKLSQLILTNERVKLSIILFLALRVGKRRPNPC